MTVVLLRRTPVLEHHARRHGIRPLDVRVVETFDVPRKLRQPEVRLHPLQKALRPLLRIVLFHVLQVVRPRLTRVPLRHLQQLRLVPPPRNSEAHLRHLNLRRLGHDNLVVLHAERRPYLVHRVGQQLRPRLVEAPLVAQSHTPHHRPATHVHIVHVNVRRTVVVYPEHIDVGYRLAHDNALRRIVLQQLVTLLQLLRLLEAQLPGQTRHLLPEIVHQLLSLPAEYLPHPVDVHPVFLRRNRARTAALAALDVVLQTETPLLLPQIFRSYRQTARPYRIKLRDKVQHRPRHASVRVRTEVFRTVLHMLARKKNPRIELVCHHNPRIRLVVLQKHIVARLVLLDH